MSVDSSNVAQYINQYLRDNLEHLAISHIINSIAGTTELELYGDLLQGVQDRIRQVGQELHGINQQLNIVRRGGQSDLVEGLSRSKEEREQERKEILRARSLIRLMTLDPTEVSAGAFLEGKDKKQKGDSLFLFLDRLREQALPEDRFVYEEVRNLLNQVHNQEEGSQNIYCTDSSNPKVMLEIGQVPVVSCQSYDGGSYNECLLGYSEPNTKILIVRNEKGNVIARSIFRLLSTPEGKPALHVERIYKAVASEAIGRIVYTQAVKKAEEMGVPVAVSKISQTETGNMEEAAKARGFSLAPVKYSLKSLASRAPSVYVDSAGGSTHGEYELRDLLELRPAA